MSQRVVEGVVKKCGIDLLLFFLLFVLLIGVLVIVVCVFCLFFVINIRCSGSGYVAVISLSTIFFYTF